MSDASFQPVLAFLFVVARLGGLALIAPWYGRALPPRIRILLVVAASLALTPMYTDAVSLPPNLTACVVAVGRELTLGMAYGLAVLILVAGLQLAGQVVSQMGGMQASDVLSADGQSRVPVISQFLELVTLGVFLLMGGHRQLLAAVMDSFQWMPPGAAVVSRDLVLALADVAGHSFELGLRVAAPVVASLLISTLVLGIISRTVPQLNVLTIGFGVNNFVLLGGLLISLGAIVLVFQGYANSAFEQVEQAVVRSLERPET